MFIIDCIVHVFLSQVFGETCTASTHFMRRIHSHMKARVGFTSQVRIHSCGIHISHLSAKNSDAESRKLRLAQIFGIFHFFVVRNWKPFLDENVDFYDKLSVT